MKITRYKKAQRHLLFYRNYFEFRPPFQIILDATFCQAALKNKVNIKEQLPKYLNEELKLLTTVCVVNEAEKISNAVYGAMLIVKQFPIHKCGHEKKPIPANECLYSLLKKKNEHYFLATQDSDLTEKVRQLAYVPILFLRMNTIILEKPADGAKEKAIVSQERFHNVDSHQFKTLKKLKKIESIDNAENTKKRKRKTVKGPNPLSCKKKKVNPNKNPIKENPNNEENSKDKRKRKRNKRIPNHIKRMIHKLELDNNNLSDQKNI